MPRSKAKGKSKITKPKATSAKDQVQAKDKDTKEPLNSLEVTQLYSEEEYEGNEDEDMTFETYNEPEPEPEPFIKSSPEDADPMTRREEFRDFLDKKGLIDLLKGTFMSLYSQQNRKGDPLAFFTNKLAELIPSQSGLCSLRNEIEHLQLELSHLEEENKQIRKLLRGCEGEVNDRGPDGVLIVSDESDGICDDVLEDEEEEEAEEEGIDHLELEYRGEGE